MTRLHYLIKNLNLRLEQGNLKTHMQRHSGQLPARRYGPRKQPAHNRHGHTSAAFPSTANRSHLKSTDDESISPLEHSMASSAHHSNQQLSSAIVLATGETLNSSHVLKLVHAVSSREQAAIDSISISGQQTHAHRGQVSSPPMATQFGPSRFYAVAPSMVPIAHSASWLAAAGVATGLGGKGRPSASPYEQFSLGPYASFTQHPGSHLNRISLLNTPQATHTSSVTVNSTDQEKQPQVTETVSTSSSQHQQYAQQPTANPDFSQLLEN